MLSRVGKKSALVLAVSLILGIQSCLFSNRDDGKSGPGSGSISLTSPKAGDTIVAGNALWITWEPSDKNIYNYWRLFKDTQPSEPGWHDLFGSGVEFRIPPMSESSNRYRVGFYLGYNGMGSNINQVAFFSDSFSIKGVNPDAYEPDNSKLTAKVIADSSTQSRNFTFLDTDWVRLDSKKGGKLLISVQST